MPDDREVIFELRRIGAAVKVVAVDVATGIEASILGPASSGEAALCRVARQKLDWLLARRPPPPER
jgi:hypothetical protein